MLPLLAQLVAPPLQNSPIRLPGPEAGQQRPDERKAPVPVEIQVGPSTPIKTPRPVETKPGERKEPEPQTVSNLPTVTGLTIYSAKELTRILGNCGTQGKADERLKACAAALTAKLVADGYVNTRVYTDEKTSPGHLTVVEGRIVELRVKSEDPRVARRVQRLLSPLQGAILHLPTIERQLQLLKRLPGITNVRGNLSRLGSDPSQGVFTVSLQPAGTPWQGEVSIRNDGSNGSGEGRAIGTLVKGDLATRGDTFLVYGEVDSDNSPSLGAVITSASYTFPIMDQLTFTGSFGYSRRNLIELPSPSNGISTNQFQGLGQFEWVLKDTLVERWSIFAGFSGNQSTTYLDGQTLPDVVPESVRIPKNGYVRVGINANGMNGLVGWSGNIYLLQGIAGVTPEQQRKELALAGIYPGSASALGGLISVGWGFAPSWQLNLRAAGQWGINPLTSSMQFSVGSDAGIRGLPGQLISGDSGWLGTAETSWTFWQDRSNTLQLVPFIGIGGVETSLKGLTLSDTVGSGGILARWLAGNDWQFELGWVEQFQTNDNLGSWTDWALGKGLYAQIKYRF